MLGMFTTTPGSFLWSAAMSVLVCVSELNCDTYWERTRCLCTHPFYINKQSGRCLECFHYLNTVLFDRHRQSFVKNNFMGLEIVCCSFKSHIGCLTEVMLLITGEQILQQQNFIHDRLAYCSEFSEILWIWIQRYSNLIMFVLTRV